MVNFKKKIYGFWNFNKILFVTGMIVVGGLIPVSLFHEFGHAIICVNNGYSYTVSFDGINFVTECSHSMEPVWLARSIGGMFGIIMSLTPLTIRKIRNNRSALLGLTILGFSQVVNGFSETFLYSWYLTPNAKPLITIFVFIFMGYILLKYGMPKKDTVTFD